MTGPLRVLLLEDLPDDAALVERELRKTLPDAVVRCVDGGEAFAAALAEFEPALILSDHRLGTFNGMDALAMVRRRSPDTPFIFITGTLDEETAVECIKAGAWDYVLKDRLVRLGPAITAALELKDARAALRSSEERLLHAQRMDALGSLAGGVAHDYNNLTTAMLGYCELVLDTLDADDARRADMEEIRLAAESAAGLSRQLLAFSRKQVMDLRPLQLNRVVAGTERLLRRLIGDVVELETALAPDLPAVRSDAGQLEQVLVNLVVNARDAMPDGGVVRIETARVTIDESHCATNPDARPGPHVVLTVSDTGAGIDAATLERLFEPFFTTKPRGQGTGLGLATVYGIVRQSDGHIAVHSEPGQGSAFSVYLPEAEAPTTVETPDADRDGPIRSGTEVILVVDDDPALRSLVRRVLERHGYHVLEASSGAEALAVSADAGRPIDILLTDVVMPEMSGPQLAVRFLQQRPTVPVLYMSGYTDNEVERHGIAESGAPFLQKPFTPDTLARKLRHVLDQS